MLDNRSYGPEAITLEPETRSWERELRGPCADETCGVETPPGTQLTLPRATTVTVLEGGDERHLVQLTGACMSAELWVEAAAVCSAGPLIAKGGLCGGFTLDDYTVAPGAPIYWPDGRRAGEVGYEKRLHRGRARELGARTCFHLDRTGRTACSSQPGFDQCFEPDDLRTIGASRS